MAAVIEFKMENGTLEWESAIGWTPVGVELRIDGVIGYFSWDGETLTRKSGSGRPTYRYNINRDGLYKAGPSYAHRVKMGAFDKALVNLEEAKLWVRKYHTVEPNPDHGDRMVVDGKSVRIESGEGLVEMRRLTAIHGPSVLEDYFGEIQRSWVEGLKDFEAALRYLRGRYTITPSQFNGLEMVTFERSGKRYQLFLDESERGCVGYDPDYFDEVSTLALVHGKKLLRELLVLSENK